MTQKNEKVPANKADIDPETTPAKPVVTAALPPERINKRRAVPGSAVDWSPELIELVTELRDTVKRLDPRKHTAKTLRRALTNVRDILTDIEALDIES
ncbi:conserved hypothetical protein [Candidatus Methylobacter favarea]|uniref:Uncharacterized protein n=1 Tax=Candidatus Methylobacter favarea TaxID=2707345 RepID=A0A8S0X988_9GAMM|nr:hypothetical protein [Candidatus Methylobacter favarea]CAA9891986.1 conserved hypothetical protein [Candidatus Methylobacter favarea]